MSYYSTCPHCGAHLDPGEICDCQDKKEAAAGATNTDGSRAEKDLKDPFFRLHDSKGSKKNQGGKQK